MGFVETEGVDVILEEKRTRGFWRLFVPWAGFTIVITNFLFGSLAVEASLVSGLLAAVVSILSVGVIVYFGTKIAAVEGTAGTTAMRAPFGVFSSAVVAGRLYYGLYRPVNARISESPTATARPDRQR